MWIERLCHVGGSLPIMAIAFGPQVQNCFGSKLSPTFLITNEPPRSCPQFRISTELVMSRAKVSASSIEQCRTPLVHDAKHGCWRYVGCAQGAGRECVQQPKQGGLAALRRRACRRQHWRDVEAVVSMREHGPERDG